MGKSKKKQAGPITKYKHWLRAYQLKDRDRWTVFNPSGRPLSELPVVYGYEAMFKWKVSFVGLLSDAGDSYAIVIGGGIDAPSRLGVVSGSRPDVDQYLRARHPNGYRMEFVPWVDFEAHEGLAKALRNQAIREASHGLGALRVTPPQVDPTRLTYTDRIKSAMKQINATLSSRDTRGLCVADVRHDPACGHLQGGDCNCEPTIAIDTPRGICTVDRHGNPSLPSVTN